MHLGVKKKSSHKILWILWMPIMNLESSIYNVLNQIFVEIASLCSYLRVHPTQFNELYSRERVKNIFRQMAGILVLISSILCAGSWCWKAEEGNQWRTEKSWQLRTRHLVNCWRKIIFWRIKEPFVEFKKRLYSKNEEIIVTNKYQALETSIVQEGEGKSMK